MGQRGMRAPLISVSSLNSELFTGQKQRLKRRERESYIGVEKSRRNLGDQNSTSLWICHGFIVVGRFFNQNWQADRNPLAYMMNIQS